MWHYALLFILALVQSCIAPPVADAVLVPSYVEAAISFASSDVPSNTCRDIDNCRTMAGVVTSCVGTIFACIWVAVHPNVPGPKQSWRSRQIESLRVMVMTLLVPEWVLAWALRQFLQAVNYAEMLEKASLEAERLEKKRPKLERLKKEKVRLETENLEMKGLEEDLEMEGLDDDTRAPTPKRLTGCTRDGRDIMNEDNKAIPLLYTERSYQGVRPELQDVSRPHKSIGWVSTIMTRVLFHFCEVWDWMSARWSSNNSRSQIAEERSFWVGY